MRVAAATGHAIGLLVYLTESYWDMRLVFDTGTLERMHCHTSVKDWFRYTGAAIYRIICSFRGDGGMYRAGYERCDAPREVLTVANLTSHSSIIRCIDGKTRRLIFAVTSSSGCSHWRSGRVASIRKEGHLGVRQRSLAIPCSTFFDYWSRKHTSGPFLPSDRAEP